MARDGTCPGSDTYKSPGSFCCPSRQACSTHAASGCSFSTNGSYESCGHAQCAQLAKLAAKQVLLHLHICGCTLLRPIKPRKPIGIDFLLWLVATEGISCVENKLDRPSQESPSSKGMLRTLLVAVELALHSHDITKLTQLSFFSMDITEKTPRRWSRLHLRTHDVSPEKPAQFHEHPLPSVAGD